MAEFEFVFEFVDEPPRVRDKGKPKSAWRLFGEAHPGQWFIVERNRRTYRTLNTTMRGGGWKMVNRRNTDGTFTIYARYDTEV